MTAPATIRERISGARAFFEAVDAILLTTFTFSPPFVEDQVLPVVLGVEEGTPAARRAAVHQALGQTPVTVLYDPTTDPKGNGRYRYVAQPVPLLRRLFHPKIVIIAGKKDGQTWIYMAVSSANLTFSGWGRNAESFGETWIHTQQQQPAQALDGLLQWVRNRPHVLNEISEDALSRIGEAIHSLPDRRRFRDDPDQPWSGTLHARFYASVVHTEGLAAFMRNGRARRPTQLWAYSPYWGDVSANVDAFHASQTVLVPATRRDGRGVGMSQAQASELPDGTDIHRNPQDQTRFWHAKAYWLEQGTTTTTAAGSCNFTSAGLRGGQGNVEAMLVYTTSEDWLPEGEPLSKQDLADEPAAEEEAPAPAPIAITVTWNWRTHKWSWCIQAPKAVRDMVLTLPGESPMDVEAGTGSTSGPQPGPGARFEIAYDIDGIRDKFDRAVTEINLHHSTLTYGRPLTAHEILASWRGTPPAMPGDGEHDDAQEIGAGDTEDTVTAGAPSIFDAFNLYDLYRSVRTLRKTLRELDGHPALQRAYLNGRPDSVMALSRLAPDNDTVPVVCYLVLHELLGLASDFSHVLDSEILQRLSHQTDDARERTQTELADELECRDTDPAAILRWFEEQLDGLKGQAA